MKAIKQTETDETIQITPDAPVIPPGKPLGVDWVYSAPEEPGYRQRYQWAVRIVNLCGKHPIRLMVGEQLLVINPSGQARVDMAVKHAKIGNMDFKSVAFDRVVGLPEPEPGVIYVVSDMVHKVIGDKRPDVMTLGDKIADVAGNTKDAHGTPYGNVGLEGRWDLLGRFWWLHVPRPLAA